MSVTYQRCPDVVLEDLLQRHRDSHPSGVKVAQVDRQDTARATLDDFFMAVSQLTHRSLGCTAAMVDAVGLKCAGRSSVFDLWWFVEQADKVYAVDVRDSGFVCVVYIN